MRRRWHASTHSDYRIRDIWERLADWGGVWVRIVGADRNQLVVHHFSQLISPVEAHRGQVLWLFSLGTYVFLKLLLHLSGGFSDSHPSSIEQITKLDSLARRLSR